MEPSNGGLFGAGGVFFRNLAPEKIQIPTPEPWASMGPGDVSIQADEQTLWPLKPASFQIHLGEIFVDNVYKDIKVYILRNDCKHLNGQFSTSVSSAAIRATFWVQIRLISPAAQAMTMIKQMHMMKQTCVCGNICARHRSGTSSGPRAGDLQPDAGSGVGNSWLVMSELSASREKD